LACRRRYQPGSAQVLQVLRSIGDGEPGAFGQRLHAALALGDELEQFEPVLVSQGFGDGSELDIERAHRAAT